jgi:hypothetical protein
MKPETHAQRLPCSVQYFAQLPFRVLMLPFLVAAVSAGILHRERSAGAREPIRLDVQRAKTSFEGGGVVENRPQSESVSLDSRLERWHQGQIEVDGQWLAVEDIQRRTANDPRQAAYQRLRSAYGGSPAGQLALARWCRRNRLRDEGRFHWASVVSVAPNHKESLRALDVRWYRGELLTSGQIDQRKETLRTAERSARVWFPVVVAWDRRLSTEDNRERAQAIREISGVHDPWAIPSFERLTLDTERVD